MNVDKLLEKEASNIKNGEDAETSNGKKGEDDDDHFKMETDGDCRIDNASSRSSMVLANSQAEAVTSENQISKLKTAINDKKVPRYNRQKKTGRVEKRRPRRQNKKPGKRNTPRNRITRKKRSDSTSTAPSKRSSRANTEKPSRCPYCGHRCCRRRFEATKRTKKKLRENRKRKTRVKVKNLVIREQQDDSKKAEQNISRSECVQVGSKCPMLSLLCENTNVSSNQETRDLPMYNEVRVTPEMIYETLRRLTLWRHDVATFTILEYIKRNYPVCQDIPALFEELSVKLQVAAIVGLVTEADQGRWRLSCALEKSQLTPNHVTIFWITYADTMSPVTKKNIPIPTQKPEEQGTSTEKSKSTPVSHDYDVI